MRVLRFAVLVGVAYATAFVASAIAIYGTGLAAWEGDERPGPLQGLVEHQEWVLSLGCAAAALVTAVCVDRLLQRRRRTVTGGSGPPTSHPT